nr:hypothetical protein Q903MT_gene528 [Picea sitchensis]
MPLVKQLILLIVIEIQILMFVSVIQLLMIVIEMNIVKNESQILFFEIEIQSLNLESEPKIHTFVSEIQFVSGILLIFVVEIQFLISETQKQMLSQFILFMIATIGPGNTWKFRRWTGLVANAHMHLNHHYCYYLPLLPMLRWLPYPYIPLGLSHYVHIGYSTRFHIGLDDVPFLILVIQIMTFEIENLPEGSTSS